MYILPQKNQVRTAIFEEYDNDGFRIIDYIPKELVVKIDKQEMVIHLKNSQGKLSKIIFTGSDADSKVGGNVKGVIFSEFALCNPNIYYLLEPMLRANKGRCLMISTPRGKNHFYTLYEEFKRDTSGNKYAELLTIKDTCNHFGRRLVSDNDFEEVLKSGVPLEIAKQEYFCDFEVALAGAYYKEQIAKLEASRNERFFSGRINPNQQLYVAFDIGGANKNNDSAVLWVYQLYNGKVIIHECFASKGQTTNFYLDYINRLSIENKLLLPVTIVLPHDSQRIENTSGRTQLDYIREKGYPVILISKTDSVLDDINFVRTHFDKTMWNINSTMIGLEMLKGYTKKYNKNTMTFDDRSPLHNDNSNYADAFRYMVIHSVHTFENKIGGVNKVRYA